MATNAVVFDASDDYGKIDNFAGFDGLTNYTVEAWVKMNASSVAYAPLWELGDGVTAVNYLIALSTENGVGNQGFNMTTNYSGTNADGYEADARLTNGTFVHVAQVHSTATLKTHVFINGVENFGYNLQQTATLTIQDSTGYHMYLARIHEGGKLAKMSIGGFFRVWNRALTGAEIYKNYDLSVTPASETGLIVNCNFSEGSGTVIDNDATPGADINLTGSPAWETGPTITAKTYTNTYLFSQIAASTDDAEEARTATTMSLTSGDYEISADGGVAQHFGLRFLNLTIPAGATIQSAYFRFTANTTISAGTVNIDIYGNDVDDATTFTTTNGDISTRTRTTATVVFTVGACAPNTIYSTGDVKTIIQEIVDRGGWASGNDMAFMFIAPNNTTTYATYVSYNGQPFSSAMLHIEYTTSSGPAGLKTWDGLAKISVKTIEGLAIASVKTINGLA